jgi:tRNA dimethylallyltransferase
MVPRISPFKDQDKPRVAVLVGPTAVGKTAVALALAQAVGAEIVNADSVQVYRELDIGTAKPTAAERALVPHHLLDAAAPPEIYDAARYSLEGREVLARLQARQVPPLVVGGTGLYVKALLHGLFAEGSPRRGVRQRLREELTGYGPEFLHQRLAALDPPTAARLHPRDTYRLLRALEVMETTGQPLSALLAAHRFQDSPYRVLKIGLNLPREELYRRITLRLDLMLAQGWLAEVRGLLERYPPSLKPFQSIGYRHLSNFLTGRWSWEEAVTLLLRDTRRYAKRQLTWFRSDPEIQWFQPDQLAEMTDLLQAFWAGGRVA